MAEMPTCAKCSKQHWHFTDCAKVENFRKAVAEKQAKAELRVTRIPREGIRPLGDRFHTYHRTAENVFMLSTKAPSLGSLTLPDEAA